MKSHLIYDDPMVPRSRQKRKAPATVSIDQAREGSWSGNPQLGNSIKSFDTAIDPVLGIVVGNTLSQNFRETILKLDEWGPPEVWTVMLGMTYSEDAWPVANNFLGITAEIEVGVGGASQAFEVDWVQGTMLSLPMNAINVTARYSVAQNPVVPADLRLNVLLAKGSRASGIRPHFSEYEVILAGVAGIYHRIPNFCHRVQLLPAFSVQTAVDLYNPNSFLNFGTGPAPVMGYGFVLGSQLLSFPDGIPVPGASHNVRFFNASPNTVRLSWLYYLQL